MGTTPSTTDLYNNIKWTTIELISIDYRKKRLTTSTTGLEPLTEAKLSINLNLPVTLANTSIRFDQFDGN